jgi:rare lipoprotein A
MKNRRYATFSIRRRTLGLASATLVCALAGCHRSQPQPPPAPPPPPQAQAQQPQAQHPRAPAQTGIASYYGREFAGKTTASGEPHDPNAMTAASRSLPLGITARVTNHETGKSVSVEVNDRGPYAKHRIIDVSPKAAKHLGMKHEGVAPVTVQPLNVPPPDSRPAG